VILTFVRERQGLEPVVCVPGAAVLFAVLVTLNLVGCGAQHKAAQTTSRSIKAKLWSEAEVVRIFARHGVRLVEQDAATGDVSLAGRRKRALIQVTVFATSAGKYAASASCFPKPCTEREQTERNVFVAWQGSFPGIKHALHDLR
jgi:hypothetical protein